jgi:PAS domain S-box-containing protein
MSNPGRRDIEIRVLFLPPTKKDGVSGIKILEMAGYHCCACSSLSEVCQEIPLGAGVVILPEESILGENLSTFAGVLASQPQWSNLPVLVLIGSGRVSSRRLHSLLEIGDVTLLKRPLDIVEFTNAIGSALRDRLRQYQVQDYLVEHERHAVALRDKEERLQFALSAGRMGSWEVDLKTYQMQCSDICKSNFGRSPDDTFTYEQLFASIHPEDRPRVGQAVEKAIEERSAYDTEYRTQWPDGSLHWILARGSCAYGLDGTPLRISGITLDVTERKRSEEALREADRRKDEFLAMLAHELRNPLAPIRNGLQVLRMTEGDRPVIGKLTDMMQRQVEHLARLVDDLLDVSRITRGKVDLRKEVIDLNDVIVRGVETIRPLIEARRHELLVSQPGKSLYIQADITRMIQVVGNLLNNAAKYSEENSRIELLLEEDGEKVAIRVRDNGVGIAADMLPGIFEIFSQVDRTLDRSQGGLGIGLTLVRSLVEMHEGSVEARSEGLGKGSEFVVRLPLLKQIPSAPSFSNPLLGEVPLPQRILVVDDNIDAADSLALLLQLRGHEIRTANHGLRVVDAVNDFQPGVVLLDIGLPGIDGFEVARRLRAIPHGEALLLIALTGYGQEDDRRRTREAGFNYHLTKPADPSVLEKLLEQHS